MFPRAKEHYYSNITSFYFLLIFIFSEYSENHCLQFDQWSIKGIVRKEFFLESTIRKIPKYGISGVKYEQTEHHDRWEVRGGVSGRRLSSPHLQIMFRAWAVEASARQLRLRCLSSDVTMGDPGVTMTMQLVTNGQLVKWKQIQQVARPPMSSSDWDLTFTWHLPDLQTIIWPSPDPYLTLILVCLQLKKSCVVGGGGWWWINPLQTLSQGLVLTLLSRLALSLTISVR